MLNTSRRQDMFIKDRSGVVICCLCCWDMFIASILVVMHSLPRPF
jgi:hypothetical protein